jgi:hypothetical protein
MFALFSASESCLQSCTTLLATLFILAPKWTLRSGDEYFWARFKPSKVPRVGIGDLRIDE